MTRTQPILSHNNSFLIVNRLSEVCLKGRSSVFGECRTSAQPQGQRFINSLSSSFKTRALTLLDRRRATTLLPEQPNPAQTITTIIH